MIVCLPGFLISTQPYTVEIVLPLPFLSQMWVKYCFKIFGIVEIVEIVQITGSSKYLMDF